MQHPDTVEKLSNSYLLEYLTRVRLVSISRYNQSLSVLKHLYNNVLGQKSKLKNTFPIKQYPKLKTLPNIEDVKLKISNTKFIKHKAILTTLLTTGLRVSELLDLRISDIDSSTMKLLVRNGKGGVSSFVILTDNLLVLLREYYKKCRLKEYLFEGSVGKYSKSSVTNIVKNNIGKEYSPHWLRKVAITYVINKNIPMPKAKLFSRHKSDSAIAFYYHYDNSTFDELRGLMNNMAV